MTRGKTCLEDRYNDRLFVFGYENSVCNEYRESIIAFLILNVNFSNHFIAAFILLYCKRENKLSEKLKTKQNIYEVSRCETVTRLNGYDHFIGCVTKTDRVIFIRCFPFSNACE